MTMSSIRFRNSGGKVWVSASVDLLAGLLLDAPRRRCTGEPTFEVMIRTVFLKSTVRPWPSVSRPSSMIWSRVLKTSGWAFSISSSRITE